MNPLLTRKQKAILDFINRYTQDEGRPPTLKEIANQFGFASDNSVRTHLRLIHKKGYIAKEPNKARGLKTTEFLKISSLNAIKIPLIGSIAAGKPITALENLEKYISVDRDLFKGNDIFALRTKGDSMTGAGINDGDIVIIHPQSDAENGEIVVAIIGDEATLKFFHREGDSIILKASNPLYSDIKIDPSSSSDIKIIGKVIGLIRKL
ncbi:MAG: transcriptional repressor LexA [Deltaproteobacteria bacterium]|nr:transcriptional repressor LexA [Deltaproteobacteria bacterium]